MHHQRKTILDKGVQVDCYLVALHTLVAVIRTSCTCMEDEMIMIFVKELSVLTLVSEWGVQIASLYSYGLCLFALASQTWSLLKTSTEDCDPPTGRYAHICTLNGPLMYIQGGSCLTRGYRFRFTADVLSFNLDTHTWRMVPCDGLDTRELPVAREFHSGHYVNGNIYIFGGKCTYTHTHTHTQICSCSPRPIT